MRTVNELSQALAKEHGELIEFTKNHTKGDGTHDYDSAALEEVERRSAAIKSLNDEREQAIRLEDTIAQSVKAMDDFKRPTRPAQHPGNGGDGGGEQNTKSVGQQFVDGDWYLQRGPSTQMQPIIANFDGLDMKSWTNGVSEAMAIKTTMTTSAGWAPFIPRSQLVVPMGQIQPVIGDLIPQEDTTVPGTQYMEETLYTNNAALVVEGATKPEAALGYTPRNVTMAKIAVNLPITDEQLTDVPQVRGMIDNRLSLMVRQSEDGYLLNNTASNGFDGFLQKSGVQNIAQGSVPIPTAVLSMMTQIEFQPGFATVSGLVMNPTDWQTYVEYQISTGAYLVGAPTDSPIKTMWGMPIIRTNIMPQGTILMGDFMRYSQILRRMALNIQVGWINDDFTKNIQRIQAEERMVLMILRASAFGTITSVH